MIVVVASIKGAPGVTTTATALANTWPPGRRVLLVEADPFGGDLAAWFGVAPSTGLWSLLAAGRRGLDPHAVWDHATNLPGGLAVLYGLASADQAVANEAAWPAGAEALAALDADVSSTPAGCCLTSPGVLARCSPWPRFSWCSVPPRWRESSTSRLHCLRSSLPHRRGSFSCCQQHRKAFRPKRSPQL